MADASRDVSRTVKEYVLNELFPGENPEILNDETPLITGGLLDSVEVMKLVVFLEDTYGVEFQAHEATADHMDTLERIARAVRAKIEQDA